MPIYEYKCQKCGHALEVMAKVSDPAPAKCEQCGELNTMERLVSRTNFQLKGGGWYSDLYASAKKDTASTTASTSGTPAASGATSTAAPAAAAPSTPSSTGGSSTGGSSSGGSSSGGSSSGGGSST